VKTALHWITQKQSPATAQIGGRLATSQKVWRWWLVEDVPRSDVGTFGDYVCWCLKSLVINQSTKTYTGFVASPVYVFLSFLDLKCHI